MQSDLPRLLHSDTSSSLTRRPHCALPRLSELDNYQRSSAPAAPVHPRPLPDSHPSTSAPRSILPPTPPPTSTLHSPPVTTSPDTDNWPSIKPSSRHATYPLAPPSSANDPLPRPSADQFSHTDNLNLAHPPPPRPTPPPSTTSTSRSTSHPSQTQTSSLTITDQNAPHPSHPPSEHPSSLCLARVQDHSLSRDTQPLRDFSPFKTPARPTTPPSHPSSAIRTAPPQSSSPSATLAPPNGIPPASRPPRYSTPPSPAQTPKPAPKARHHSAHPQSHMVRFVGRSNSAEAMPPPSSPSQWSPDRPESIRSNPPRISTMAASSSSILALDTGSHPKPTATNPQPGMTTLPSLHAHRDGRTLGSPVTLMCDQCKVKPVDGTDAFVMQCGPYAHSLQCPDCQAKEAGEIDYPNRTQNNKRKSPPSPSDPLEDQSSSSKARKVTPDRPPSAGRELDSLATSRPSDPEGRPQLTVSEANEIFHLLIKTPETDEEISQDRQLRDTVYKLGPPQADRLNGTCHR